MFGKSNHLPFLNDFSVFGKLIEYQVKLVAIAACALFVLFEFMGIKHLEKSLTKMCLAAFGILAAYVFAGSFFIRPEAFTPFMPNGFDSVLIVAGLCFISFGGLIKVSDIADKVKNPGRNIPLGMSLAFIIVTIFYVWIAIVTVGVADPQLLKETFTPLSVGAGSFMGMPGRIIMETAALLLFLITSYVCISSAVHAPLAMSEDGLLPEIFQKTNRRFKMPYLSNIVNAVFG